MRQHFFTFSNYFLLAPNFFPSMEALIECEKIENASFNFQALNCKDASFFSHEEKVTQIYLFYIYIYISSKLPWKRDNGVIYTAVLILFFSESNSFFSPLSQILDLLLKEIKKGGGKDEMQILLCLPCSCSLGSRSLRKPQMDTMSFFFFFFSKDSLFLPSFNCRIIMLLFQAAGWVSLGLIPAAAATVCTKELIGKCSLNLVTTWNGFFSLGCSLLCFLASLPTRLNFYNCIRIFLLLISPLILYWRTCVTYLHYMLLGNLVGKELVLSRRSRRSRREIKRKSSRIFFRL